MTTTIIDKGGANVEVNVWVEVKTVGGRKYYSFASLSDECNYLYSATSFSFEEAKARYEADHEHEHCQYHYIVK